LLTLCFEIIASMGERRGIPSSIVAETSRVIAQAAGTGGLITGQVLDLEADGGSRAQYYRALALVDIIHEHKTAKVIAASMEAGAVCAEADPETRGDIRTAGLKAGRAFQIVDDMLDLQTDAAIIGKTPGKDLRQGKLTYPSVAGLQASRERAAALIAEAKASLERIGTSAPLFSAMDFILSRTA
jgi:geranylgeranyl diphosphate synthase type II